MTAFKVTIAVNDTELGKVLSGLSRKQIAEADIVPIREVENNKPASAATTMPIGRAAGMTIIMKGDRIDPPSGQKSYLNPVFKVHERMEAQQGIGTITRRALTKEAKHRIGKFRAAHISALIEGGWLTYVRNERGE